MSTELPDVRPRWWPPPAWAWLLLLPALFIGVQELRRGGRIRVDLAGAGLVARLLDAPPPEGVRFAGAPARRASLETSVERVRLREPERFRLFEPEVRDRCASGSRASRL